VKTFRARGRLPQSCGRGGEAKDQKGGLAEAEGGAQWQRRKCLFAFKGAKETKARIVPRRPNRLRQEKQFLKEKTSRAEKGKIRLEKK